MYDYGITGLYEEEEYQTNKENAIFGILFFMYFSLRALFDEMKHASKHSISDFFFQRSVSKEL